MMAHGSLLSRPSMTACTCLTPIACQQMSPSTMVASSSSGRRLGAGRGTPSRPMREPEVRDAPDTRWQRQAPHLLLHSTLRHMSAASHCSSCGTAVCQASAFLCTVFCWTAAPSLEMLARPSTGIALKVLPTRMCRLNAGAVCYRCSCMASNNYFGAAVAWSLVCCDAMLLSLLLCKTETAMLPLQAQCSGPSHSPRQCWLSVWARRRCLLLLTPLLPGFWWCTGQPPRRGMQPQPARQQRARRRQASPHLEAPSPQRAPQLRTASMAHHEQPAQSPGAAVM